MLEHETDGRWLRRFGGDPGLGFADHATAYYMTETGDAVLLEPAGSRQELADKLALVEARRAARKAAERERWDRSGRAREPLRSPVRRPDRAGLVDGCGRDSLGATVIDARGEALRSRSRPAVSSGRPRLAQSFSTTTRGSRWVRFRLADGRLVRGHVRARHGQPLWADVRDLMRISTPVSIGRRLRRPVLRRPRVGHPGQATHGGGPSGGIGPRAGSHARVPRREDNRITERGTARDRKRERDLERLRAMPSPRPAPRPLLGRPARSSATWATAAKRSPTRTAARPSPAATSARSSASDDGQDRGHLLVEQLKYLALGRRVNPSAS